MSRVKEFAFAAGTIIVLLVLPVSCTVYKYKDCKRVGHSTFYCLFLNGGR